MTETLLIKINDDAILSIEQDLYIKCKKQKRLHVSPKTEK